MSNINGAASEARVKMMKVNTSKMHKSWYYNNKKLSKLSPITATIADEIFINDTFDVHFLHWK